MRACSQARSGRFGATRFARAIAANARWLSPSASACRASPANSSGLPDVGEVDAPVLAVPRCGPWLAHAVSTSTAASTTRRIERAFGSMVMALSLTAWRPWRVHRHGSAIHRWALVQAIAASVRSAHALEYRPSGGSVLMEDLKPHRHAGRSRLVLGLFLLALGGVMLAVNLGYEMPTGWWRYFPVPLIALGLWGLVVPSRHLDRSGGIWLLATGLYCLVGVFRLFGLGWGTRLADLRHRFGLELPGPRLRSRAPRPHAGCLRRVSSMDFDHEPRDRRARAPRRNATQPRSSRADLGPTGGRHRHRPHRRDSAGRQSRLVRGPLRAAQPVAAGAGRGRRDDGAQPGSPPQPLLGLGADHGRHVGLPRSHRLDSRQPVASAAARPVAVRRRLAGVARASTVRRSRNRSRAPTITWSSCARSR